MANTFSQLTATYDIDTRSSTRGTRDHDVHCRTEECTMTCNFEYIDDLTN